MDPIEVRDLTKEYGSVRGVDSLSFSVESGEVFGFLGPNGAGKTTTIKTLLGLLTPTEGTADVLGADIRDEDALIEAKRRIGYLPAELGFNEEVTGERVLKYHESVKGGERKADLLEVFTPPLERPIREYSSGNRRMLGLVQAFMHDPDLVILDEPTSGLDPLKQAEFNEFIRDEQERGTTIFFSSHVLSEVRRICDRVGILGNGQLVGLEDIETLIDQSGKRVQVRIGTDEAEEVIELDGVIEATGIGEQLQFTYVGDYNKLFRVLAEQHVLDVEISEPPLEDVFMHYYGAKEPDPNLSAEVANV